MKLRAIPSEWELPDTSRIPGVLTCIGRDSLGPLIEAETQKEADADSIAELFAMIGLSVIAASIPTVHAQTQVFGQRMGTDNPFVPCSKCFGNGVIAAFAHIRNGTCFGCAGIGFVSNLAVTARTLATADA